MADEQGIFFPQLNKGKGFDTGNKWQFLGRDTFWEDGESWAPDIKKVIRYVAEHDPSVIIGDRLRHYAGNGEYLPSPVFLDTLLRDRNPVTFSICHPGHDSVIAPEMSLTLLVNPSNISFSVAGEFQSAQTRMGVITSAGIQDPIKITMSGSAPAMVTTGMGAAHNHSSDATSRNRTSGWLTCLHLTALFNHNGAFASKQSDLWGTWAPIGSELTPVRSTLANAVMSYDGTLYNGHFNSLSITEDASMPISLKYSLAFTVTGVFGDVYEGHISSAKNTGRQIVVIDHHQESRLNLRDYAPTINPETIGFSRADMTGVLEQSLQEAAQVKQQAQVQKLSEAPTDTIVVLGDGNASYLSVALGLVSQKTIISVVNSNSKIEDWIARADVKTLSTLCTLRDVVVVLGSSDYVSPDLGSSKASTLASKLTSAGAKSIIWVMPLTFLQGSGKPKWDQYQKGVLPSAYGVKYVPILTSMGVKVFNTTQDARTKAMMSSGAEDMYNRSIDQNKIWAAAVLGEMYPGVLFPGSARAVTGSLAMFAGVSVGSNGKAPLAGMQPPHDGVEDIRYSLAGRNNKLVFTNAGFEVKPVSLFVGV